MNIDEKDNLKLIGKNEEDLKVISAYLQDSIVTVKDIVFLKKNRTFIMMVNRFMWEDIEKGVFRESKRIRCALKFEEVKTVKSHKINQRNKNKPYEFSAIECGSNIDEIYLAGGFANYIDIERAKNIGFILNYPSKKIKKIGNSALEGATKLLLSYKLRKNLLNYVTKIDHLELETKEEFFDYFVEGCQFKEISV